MNLLNRSVFAAFCCAVATTANAQEPVCPVYNDIVDTRAYLPRVAAAVAAGQELIIVALGSSSTGGSGATDASKAYPAQLEAELSRLFPKLKVRVINSGVGGETVNDMIKRLDSDVFAHKPHLVIFQVGTNTVLRDEPLDLAEAKIQEVVAMFRAAGIDVLLMNAQFAPKVEAKSGAVPMMSVLSRTAKRFGIGVFERHALMKRWHEKENMPIGQFISPDDLHMNDWSYACLAKNLGQSIAKGRFYTQNPIAVNR